MIQLPNGRLHDLMVGAVVIYAGVNVGITRYHFIKMSVIKRYGTDCFVVYGYPVTTQVRSSVRFGMVTQDKGLTDGDCTKVKVLLF